MTMHDTVARVFKETRNQSLETRLEGYQSEPDSPSGSVSAIPSGVFLQPTSSATPTPRPELPSGSASATPTGSLLRPTSSTTPTLHQWQSRNPYRNLSTPQASPVVGGNHMTINENQVVTYINSVVTIINHQ